MRTISNEELNTIIENHQHWVNRDIDNWETMRADLRFVDFRDADFRGVNLSGVDFTGADLRDTDLRDADLRNADFTKANLRGADLRYTDLRNADFTKANLRGADLRGTYLRDNDFTGADLRYTDLRGADLRDTDLKGTKMNWPLVCPSEGAFVGWKKCVTFDENGHEIPALVKLLIPGDARRTSATSRKCRASYAIVLDITDSKGNSLEIASSIHDSSFIYENGKPVIPSEFDENRWNECSGGIHFFVTKEEALEYGGYNLKMEDIR